MQELTVHSIAELEAMPKKELLDLVKQFQSEDSDALQEVNGRCKKDELVKALAEYMGLTNADLEADTVKAEVNKDIESEIENLFSDSTAESAVNALMEELGLGDDVPVEVTESAPQSAETTPKKANAKGGDAPKAEKKAKPRITIQNGPRIPIRKYEGLILGIYGDILEPLEEKDENGYEYDIVKLERFNAKAHEVFRNTNGNTILLLTRTGGSYLVAKECPNGDIDPIIEVTNKGRGHYRCRQYANVLQLAYNEKKDIRIIPDEEYRALADKIELMEIKWEGLEA